jgi:hypothetical protein
LKIQRVKKENPAFINNVVLSTILGRTPTIEEYKAAVKGINLTQFAPSQIIGKLANSKINISKSLSLYKRLRLFYEYAFSIFCTL